MNPLLDALSSVRNPNLADLEDIGRIPPKALIDALVTQGANLAGLPMDMAYLAQSGINKGMDLLGVPNPYPLGELKDTVMTSDWMADKAGVDTESIPYLVGSMLTPDPSTAVKFGPLMRAIFAGITAKNAPIEMYDKARKALDSGADPREVWREYGIFKGADGKLRHEIDDSQAAIEKSHPANWLSKEHGIDWADGSTMAEREAQIARQNEAIDEVKHWGMANGELSDYLLHSDLYQAYPGIEKSRHVFEQFDSPFGGAYSPETGRIGLAMGNLMHPEKSKSTTLHELQHAVQRQEGFATGGNPAEFKDAKKLAAYEYDQAVNRLENSLAADMLKKDFSTRFGKEPDFLVPTEDALEPLLGKDAADFYRAHPAYRALRQELDDLQAGLSSFYASGKTPDEVYRALAGEAEARAVQKRTNYSPEKRRQTYPADSMDIDLMDQIVRFD